MTVVSEALFDLPLLQEPVSMSYAHRTRTKASINRWLVTSFVNATMQTKTEYRNLEYDQTHTAMSCMISKRFGKRVCKSGGQNLIPMFYK